MVGGDEWIYVLSRQDEVKEAETAKVADAAAAGGAAEENPSKNVSDYLRYIEEEEEDDAPTVDGGDAVAAAAEALRAFQIDEASGGRGKEVVVENPFHDCYGGKHTDAEAYYGYGYEYGSGSGSASRGYGPGTGGSGYDDRYGGGYTAYSSGGAGYGYGYSDVYGYGYGFGGYYGEPPYAPPVVYRAPPAYGVYGALPLPPCQPVVPYVYCPHHI
ncbi:heterogeneous nuclear ribonucleoprotein A3 homolog 1-like [Panicum virgatum]|uniref:heterogeneous nuclear ribonucleoprotein A3 homolog 1-like n=1 Tax=Panicum virgatum TaxID=38727 RepID=UPI0019D65C22|nr:heterogeneous nuclear ribonucleoprotein A3 homolog 1-like [Panicum virgatum]